MTKAAGRIFRCSGGPAEGTHAGFDVRIEATAASMFGLDPKMTSAVWAASCLPSFGRARLHDDRPAFDRAGDVERSSDGQVLTFVVQHMHPVGIEEQTALLVAQPCIICEAVPEAGDHLLEFERSPVAFVVLDVILQPKVQCRVRVRRRHDIPSRSAIADVVQGGEAAGDGYASSNVVDAVAISPMRCVTIARADSSVSGSNDVTVALRRRAAMDMFSTARWSAMKNATKRASLQRLDEVDEVLQVEVGVGVGAPDSATRQYGFRQGA